MKFARRNKKRRSCWPPFFLPPGFSLPFLQVVERIPNTQHPTPFPSTSPLHQNRLSKGNFSLKNPILILHPNKPPLTASHPIPIPTKKNKPRSRIPLLSQRPTHERTGDKLVFLVVGNLFKKRKKKKEKRKKKKEKRKKKRINILFTSTVSN